MGMSENGKFWFFWGGPFSQWNIDGFTIDGIFYNCAEKWMMAEKARLFGDEAALKAILDSSDPRAIKGYGRQVQGFQQDVWEKIEENGKPYAWNVVYQGSWAKYSQNPGLRDFLLNETGDALLVEASPYDAIWGIKLAEDAEGIEDPKNWRGTNWLGEVLTQVRDDMRREIAEDAVVMLRKVRHLLAICEDTTDTVRALAELLGVDTRQGSTKTTFGPPVTIMPPGDTKRRRHGW